ncbi:DUF4832 domain-containing protein [Leifsonia sp. fls2-241-R2A-40a]|uniref:DUF4832 domain-containing protein n=1 Tax=Leifsonia sp. fls2-241-R2A-40a TaxID=3040290 RepID=UPI00254E6184|nr:DUF4832 domain-containing protein [Leifsonia sp. fls2-241-R2A-40a]
MKRTIAATLASLGLVAAAIAAPAVGAVSTAPSAASTPGWTALASGSEPQSNPLKGFIPYQGSYSNFPYTTEWAYFPVNAAMTGPNAFNWSQVDSVLNDIASRGHQAAFRFYLDYPTKPSGVPQFLLNGGLTTHSYNDYGNNGVSVSPNYDDSNLRTAMDQFIAALGARYDGDARVGFVQAGLLGFWGEWHTYPYNGTGGQPNWFASSATQVAVLNDFVNAFHTTKLEVRQPDSQNASLPIGYHDDSFALETKTSSLGWHFMDNMAAAGATDKWKTQSIGGELRPELQSCIFSSSGCPVIEASGDNDFSGSVSQTHVSWLLNQYAFQNGYSAADKSAALAGAQSMGYSFRATEALVPTTISAGSSASVGITVSNVGIAPFYYSWPITLALVDSSGTIVKTSTTSWHVSDIGSGGSAQFTGTLATSGVATGSYRLLAQVTNPLSGGAPIRFANAGQDTVKAGWLTLGTTTIAAGGATSASYEAEAASNVLTGTAAVASCAACSGGSKVGYVGNGATLAFTGVAGGVSSFRIAYASAVARTATVKVDGGTTTSVSFPATADWNTVGTITVNVAIPSGTSHTITIANPSGWAPDIDRITTG